MQNCIDDHHPLLYRFAFYQNRDDYQSDILSGQTLGLNYLSDYSKEDQLSFTLPIPKRPLENSDESIRALTFPSGHLPAQNLTLYPPEEAENSTETKTENKADIKSNVNELLIVALIKDSLGGVRNMTLRLAVTMPVTLNPVSILEDVRKFADTGANEVYQLSAFAASFCQFSTKDLDAEVATAADYKALVDYMNERVDILKPKHSTDLSLISILS